MSNQTRNVIVTGASAMRMLFEIDPRRIGIIKAKQVARLECLRETVEHTAIFLRGKIEVFPRIGPRRADVALR